MLMMPSVPGFMTSSNCRASATMPLRFLTPSSTSRSTWMPLSLPLSTEVQKVEMFTAARLAIDPDTRAERGFLDLLAGRLGLADPLVDHIDATVAAAKG
jgi:hypothetical protein